MPTKKIASAIVLSLGLVLFSPLTALAVTTNTNNDFVTDVNNGNADLTANPAAQADVNDVNNGEKDSANDKDDGEMVENDAVESPETVEPAAADSESSTSDSGSKDSGNNGSETSGSSQDSGNSGAGTSGSNQ